MFIAHEALENFLKEHHFPTLEATKEQPRAEEENSFFMIFPESDIRDMPFDGMWDESEDDAVWISVQATWDANGQKITDGEKKICAPFQKNGDVDALLQVKPFARTFQVKENCIPELFDVAASQKALQTLDGEVFHGERMFTYRHDEDPVDVLLFHTMFYEYPSFVPFRALLLTYPKKAKEGTATYIYFPAFRGVNFLKAYLRDIVTKITGIRFDKDACDEKSWLIFPHVTDAMGGSGYVPSKLTIGCDVYAPAYVSFNLPELSDESAVAMRRAGVIGAPCFHHKVTFMVKKGQVLPDEYYISERFGNATDDQVRPNAYPIPDVALPAGYDVKTLFHNKEYTNVSHNALWSLIDAMSGENGESSGAITKLIPYAVKQIGANEVARMAKSRAYFPEHKNERRWEPDYASCEGWKLSLFADVRVIGLFKAKDWQNDEFYVLSDTGRWYLWQEIINDPIKNSGPGGLRDCLINGLQAIHWIGIPVYRKDGTYMETDFPNWFAEALTGYVFGIGEQEGGFTYGSNVVRLLKETAKKRDVRIRTMHGDCYLSMMNDMAQIWDLVNDNPEFEDYKI